MTKGIDEIVRSGLRQKLWQPSASVRGVHIGRDEIERLIPHRDPFLFVDTISEIDLDSSRLRGQRFIAPSDPVFAGHFPGRFGLGFSRCGGVGRRHDAADGNNKDERWDRSDFFHKLPLV